MNESLPITAIICTRNRPDMAPRAVESVLRNTGVDFRLIVVDQSDNDATEKAMPASGRLQYVHLDRAGLSLAYNAGIALAGSPLIAFTDDDCVAPPHWLASVVAVFERHPDVEMLYGQTLVAPELRGTRDVVPSLTIGREEKLGRGYGFRIYGMGANFAIRRSLIERVGGFDEALGGGGPLRSSQDFDFQYRAYKHGAICLLSPDVSVDHYGLRRADEWAATQGAYGVGDGAFYLKHVRCGDLFALRLLTARLARMIVHLLLNPIRRRPSQWTYFRSVIGGMRRSLRYPVDRKRRLYRLAGSK